MEPMTHRQTGQLVLDYITNSIISIKADLVGIPFVSPDSRYVITINHRHDSVLLSVQQVTISGLVFAFDVETTLNISDIRFVKSSVSLEYDVYATTDKSEILFLSLGTGKVETITDVGEPASATWLNGGRKIKESGKSLSSISLARLSLSSHFNCSDIFSNLIASPSKDAVFIINTKSRNVTCEIAQLANPTEVVWA
jgi:follistatin-related protein 5